MSDSQSWLAGRHSKEEARRAEGARWHRRVEEWRQKIADPYRDLYNRWRPSWDSAAEKLDAVVDSPDPLREKAHTAAERFYSVARLIRQLTSLWEAGRAWRAADGIGHFGAIEESDWLFCWANPDSTSVPPAERFDPTPDTFVDECTPLSGTLALLRTVLKEPEPKVLELIQGFRELSDCRGLGGWVKLIGDVLAPPTVAMPVEKWVNELRIPDGADRAGVLYVVCKVGDYGRMGTIVNTLEGRLSSGSASPPELAPGIAEVLRQLQGAERFNDFLIYERWLARLNSPETPPLDRAAMAWHAFARTLSRPSAYPPRVRSLELLIKLWQLARVLVIAGLAERVRSLRDTHIGGRGPAIEMLRLAVDVAERHPAELEKDDAVKKALDAVVQNPAAISSLERIRDEVVVAVATPPAPATARISGADPASGRSGGRGTENNGVKGEEEPDRPFYPLNSWSEIVTALNEQAGQTGEKNFRLKNDEATRNRIRSMNEKHNGPIKMPKERGAQPKVDKAAILQWWAGLRTEYDARMEEAEKESESVKATTSETHNYGRDATVVPGIGGGVRSSKKRREPRSE